MAMLASVSEARFRTPYRSQRFAGPCRGTAWRVRDAPSTTAFAMAASRPSGRWGARSVSSSTRSRTTAPTMPKWHPGSRPFNGDPAAPPRRLPRRRVAAPRIRRRIVRRFFCLRLARADRCAGRGCAAQRAPQRRPGRPSRRRLAVHPRHRPRHAGRGRRARGALQPARCQVFAERRGVAGQRRPARGDAAGRGAGSSVRGPAHRVGGGGGRRRVDRRRPGLVGCRRCEPADRRRGSPSR